MKLPNFRMRSLLVLVALAGLLIWAGLQWVRGNQYGFNATVSRAVPKYSTLARLESVAGRGIRPAATDRLAAALRRRVERNPAQHPDGWREGDYWVFYDFPGNYRWWFQVRDGRLVNYDPAVLARQPQKVAISGVR